MKITDRGYVLTTIVHGKRYYVDADGEAFREAGYEAVPLTCNIRNARHFGSRNHALETRYIDDLYINGPFYYLEDRQVHIVNDLLVDVQLIVTTYELPEIQQ